MDVKVRLIGERAFRQAGNDESKALVGDEHAEARSRQGENQRFREKLANDASRAGTHSGADSKFMLAGGASRQQENGNIAAADSQQRAHGAKQQVESRSNVVQNPVA